jgi:hypothetical protein
LDSHTLTPDDRSMGQCLISQLARIPGIQTGCVNALSFAVNLSRLRLFIVSITSGLNSRFLSEDHTRGAMANTSNPHRETFLDSGMSSGASQI